MKTQMTKYALALALMAPFAAPANALEVEGAGVEKGEAEIAYEGTYTDDNGEGVYEHEHEIEGELGLTDWLRLSVGFGFEEEKENAILNSPKWKDQPPLNWLIQNKAALALPYMAVFLKNWLKKPEKVI